MPEVPLELDHWPAALDGLRVAVVADLHAGGIHVREARLQQIVDAVNRAGPDVVALLGDYVDTGVPLSRRVHPRVVAGILSGFVAPAVAVLGNHDWVHEGRGMADALRAAGVPLLENDALALTVHGVELWIAGVGDYHLRRALVSRALGPVPAGAPVLLLSHNPDAFPAVPDDVALTISGHTHGAQIDLPVVRRIVMPSHFGLRYHSGHVVEHGRQLYVSRGVGSTGVPARLFAPPEIPVLRLASRPCPS
jgi:predicted MPP superfamily phosphohydrolase